MTGGDSVAALGLLVVRPGMLVMATPFFGHAYAPTPMRLGLLLLLALFLAPFVTLPPVVAGSALLFIVLRELAIGLAIALAVRLLIFSAEFAGVFAGYQIGLSLGALLDPQSGVRNNMLAVLYSSLAVIICLVTNVHHALLRALLDSYQALPVGLGGVDGSIVASTARIMGLVFVTGVRLAFPIMVVLLLTELALGLLGKVAPSLNVLIAGAPVRVMVGLLAAAASLSVLPGLLARIGPDAFRIAADLARAFR